MTADELRQQYPVQAAALNRLRRAGADHADGAVIEVGGKRYRMLVDRPAAIEAHHITLQCQEAPKHQVAMVALRWTRREPYGAGVDGTGLLMRAWTEGLVVDPAGAPSPHTWRVLPFVATPRLTPRRRQQRTTD